MLLIGSLLRSLRTVIALACLITPPLAGAAGSDCDAAAPLSLPGHWRGSATAAGEAQALRFHVSEAAIVALEVTAPLAASTEPSLAVLEGCGAAPGRASFAYLERAAARQVLAVHSPGEVFVAVRAQDPAAALGPYKVIARIRGWPENLGDPAEDEVDPDPFAGPWPDKLGDPAEDEVDPDPFAGPWPEKHDDPAEDEVDPDPFAGPWPDKLGDPAEDEVDPDPFAGPWPERLGDPAEDEVDPDPFAAPWSGLARACDSGVADDHADDLTCATSLALADRVDGEIWNDWRDDEDVFTFVVAELLTVAIETAGHTDTAGGLYDRHAQRLAADGDGGDGDNFRIVKTLVPGRYFVRVEGDHGAEGRYRLSLRQLRPGDR